jgi:hypothetical protein
MYCCPEALLYVNMPQKERDAVMGEFRCGARRGWGLGATQCSGLGFRCNPVFRLHTLSGLCHVACAGTACAVVPCPRGWVGCHWHSSVEYSASHGACRLDTLHSNLRSRQSRPC